MAATTHLRNVNLQNTYAIETHAASTKFYSQENLPLYGIVFERREGVQLVQPTTIGPQNSLYGFD